MFQLQRLHSIKLHGKVIMNDVQVKIWKGKVRK